MHSFYFRRLGLMAAATAEAPPAGGAAAASTTEPEGGQEPKGEEPEPEASKPGVIDTAVAALRSKGGLAKEISALKQERDGLAKEKADLAAQLTAVTQERDELKQQFAKLEAAHAELENEQATVQTEVTHQLATAGVPETRLPKGGATAEASASIDERIADLSKRAEETKDPKEAGQLAKQAWNLMAEKSNQKPAHN